MRTIIVCLLLSFVATGCTIVDSDDGARQLSNHGPDHIFVQMDPAGKCPLYVEGRKNGNVVWCPSATNPVSGAACRHRGDRIIWHITGNELIDIKFDPKGGIDPADWDCDDNPANPFTCKVPDAVKDDEMYKYTVFVNDCPLDP
ncbi:MAG: hypothetical protein HUJ31_11445, partial [Pseudomonadales bacterium]|nr:hypothetical protein [Pseudomonadales bacterium]